MTTTTKEAVLEPSIKSVRYLLSALVEKAEELENLSEIVSQAGGKIEKADDLGIKQLAFPIAKHTSLNLVSVFFTATSGTTFALNKALRHDEAVKRYLLTKWYGDKLKKKVSPDKDKKEVKKDV